MIPIPPNEIGSAICEKYLKVDKWQKDFNLSTSTYRRISRYTGLNFTEIDNLPYYNYLLFNRDSWIDSFMQSEEGRKFLKTLWRLQQTEADEEAIRNLKRKEE